MKPMLASIIISVFLSNTYAMDDAISFEKDKVGTHPAGWISGVTGDGSHIWTVEEDDTSFGKRHVLKQSGIAKFPWCVKQDSNLSDGFVEVKFKPLSGNKDQAGGVIWHWKDGNNYYVARANALENNVSLYYTQDGNRITIQYVEAPVAKNQWHTLRATFEDRRIQISFNGITYIDVEDEHITGTGKIGLWTKADSVTEFDSFRYGKP